MFWRLIGVYGLLLVAPLGLLGYVLGQRSSDFEYERLKEGLFARAQLVRELLQRVPQGELETKIRALAKLQPDDMRITLIDSAGNVLADTHQDHDLMEDHIRRPEIQAAAERAYGTDLRTSRSTGRDLLYVAVAAPIKESSVAYIRLAVSPQAVREFRADLRHFAILTLGVSALLAIVATALMARNINGPLREISQVAESIAGGKYGLKVYSSSRGEVARLARSFNNMSERLAAQVARLEQDQEELRAILGGMIEGVIALNAEQRILFANERARGLLEFDRARPEADEAIGRHLWDVVRQRPLLDLVQRCLARPEPQQEELNFYGRFKRSLSAYAVRLHGDPPRGAILVLHDTSELRRLERLRQDFVANVSHELKTPLTVIKACLETVKDDEAIDESPSARGFLEQAEEQCERLHRLILDLLSLARIESGSELFDLAHVGLDNLVASCLARHRPRAESKRQTLAADPPTEPISAWADDEALAEILDNLVDNALKYTPPGGSVRVRWWSQEGEAFLEVKDDGIGIPEQDLSRVFERFYRVDKARSREMGGTGLGLSIVKHLAQAMKGSVDAKSEVSKGSVFIVRVPQSRK